MQDKENIDINNELFTPEDRHGFKAFFKFMPDGALVIYTAPEEITSFLKSEAIRLRDFLNYCYPEGK